MNKVYNIYLYELSDTSIEVVKVWTTPTHSTVFKVPKGSKKESKRVKM